MKQKQTYKRPVSRLCHCRKKSGATLILTLGILSVISILAVSFLSSARLQKQTAVTNRNRQAASHTIHAALATAILQIENSLSYTNFTNTDLENEDYRYFQRMAPVTQWFSEGFPESYAERNGTDYEFLFQYGPVLTSPAYSNAPAINLITPEVLSLVPPALTNGLPLNTSRALRSGWIPFNPLEGASFTAELRSNPARLAFAVFDCSGVLDANVFPDNPSQIKKQQTYFSQKGICRDIDNKGSSISKYIATNRLESVIRNNEPFFHTSYDPNPNTFRFHSGPGRDILGYEYFSINHTLDLNKPGLYKAFSGLTGGNLVYNKFNINSLTNILKKYEDSSINLWQDDFQLITEWLLPTWYISELCRKKEQEDQSLTFDKGRRVAWSIANFIDSDRIPEVSHFIDYEMPTRANFAVEDVPLISKISIFNIDDSAGNDDYIGPADKLKNYDYYDMDPNLSNHYAVAVELWYPFAPNSPYGNETDNPQLDPACYIGIYTNEADVSTTTNRAPTASELENFFGTNVIMKVLFETWAREYENEVGWEYLDGNPLWQEIRNIGDYWFTPAMINNPLWRDSAGQGEEWHSVVLTNSPLYRTFYPETYDIVSTNQTGEVSTNSYTYITQTNYWLNLTSPGGTNEFIYGQYEEDEDYMVMYWEDSVTGAVTNSLLGGIIDQNGNFIDLNYTNYMARTILYGNTTNENYMVSENADTGIITTNRISALLLSPDMETPQFTTYSNIINQYTVNQVTPLDMPPEFEQTLNELFLMLPTNSLGAMFDFMLLTTEDIEQHNQWDDLFDYFSNSPGIQNTLIPQIIEPSLGNLTEKDKYRLDPASPEFDPETTSWIKETDGPNGYFWTVYPKQSVSFMEITERIPPGAPPDSEELEVVTNCYELGTYMPGNSKPNTIWLRPATTVVGKDIMAQIGIEEDGRPLTDRIVDEALMLAKDNDYNNDTVRGWMSVTNIYVADPRDNSYANRWIEFNAEWHEENYRPDLHNGVKELPFIHFNTPLDSIGDLGHIYTEYRQWEKNNTPLTEISGDASSPSAISGFNSKEIPPEEEPGDTVDFSAATGASLLDFFTIKPNKPERGLVQANTSLKPTLDILFSDVMVGWTNSWAGGNNNWQKLNPNSHKWTTLWREALTNDLYNTGWRCFADMLPDLTTNELHKTVDVNGIQNAVEKHNYTEDVLRGIIDKVSFRQNVYVIILAAQTVAPGSSQTNPNVLAEQRVAVTVIRDAYSGNWIISDWRKLTQ
ncbi:MAG: type II secretion system protein [Kiritimatiellia bacterium]